MFLSIVQMETNGEEVQNVAPTLNSLFEIPADAFGAGAALDTSGDGKVDAAEFIQGWFFDEIANDLLGFCWRYRSLCRTSADQLDHSINLTIDGVAVTLDFDVEANDLTEDASSGPIADLIFDVDFTLTVSQDLQLDLGTGGGCPEIARLHGGRRDPGQPRDPRGRHDGVRVHLRRPHRRPGVGGPRPSTRTISFVRNADNLIRACGVP